MFERHVSISCVIASVLWVLTGVMWTLTWFVDTRPVAVGAILIGMIAATATVRTYFLSLNRRIKNALAVRAVVEDPGVRSIR